MITFAGLHRAGLLALLLCAGSGPTYPDTGGSIYHSSASEVRLIFFASDQNHRAVERLDASDFAVVDSELVIRDFRSFSRSAVVGLEAIVLADGSDSVLPQLRRERSAIMQFLRQTRWRAEDRVSLVSFAGTHPALVCAGDCPASPAVERWLTAGAQASTPFFDAVFYSSHLLAGQANSQVRPVLIIFSDGEDTISMRSLRDASEAALAGEVQIYAVDLNPNRGATGTPVLQALADATGGRYFALHEGSSTVLSAVLDDLHSGYVVTYALPSRDVGFHSVRILPTHNLKLRFRCRRGYYYRPAQ